MTNEQLKVANKMFSLLQKLNAKSNGVPELEKLLKDWIDVCIAEAETDYEFNSGELPKILEEQAV